MRFEKFKSGVYRQQYKYKDFLPGKINHEWSWSDSRINVLLEKATKALGELNAFTLIVPDVNLFIRMHIIKEANTSSRIEGTKTEMDEVLLDEKEIRPDRRDDWHEVQNYVEAMNMAVEKLKTLPLSMRLLRETHAVLLQGVRGKRKTPGEFRRSQNWIGGASLADAVFIPPHHNDLSELLGDLEAFWHNENIQVPHLIRIALSHYQFETIHPFLDGNGRIGRLLITLYLVSHGLLAKPSLYLSAHLEKHRNTYYDALSRVREANDVGHWCRFFLQAVTETAESGKNKFQRILS
jgi:Fic family protein